VEVEEEPIMTRIHILIILSIKTW